MKKHKKLSKEVHDFQDEELINSFNEILGVNTDDCLMLNHQLFTEEDQDDDMFTIESTLPDIINADNDKQPKK